VNTTTDLARWQTLARKIVQYTAIAAGALLTLGMVLSYAGLRSAYLGAGFSPRAAAAAPLTVDLLTLVAYVGLLVLAGKFYPSVVVAFGVLASAGAQGYHLSHGGVNARITDGRVIFLLGASCMIFAGLAGHLLWKILERALPREFITAMQAGGEPVRPVYAPPRLHTPPLTMAGQPDLPPIRTLGDAQRLLGDLEAADPPAIPARTTAAAATVTGPSQVTVPTGAGRGPAKIPAKKVGPRGGTSQDTGPCDPRCLEHPATDPRTGQPTGIEVSKSTRYRCRDRLNRAAAKETASHG
jgi:hypothetical protein